MTTEAVSTPIEMLLAEKRVTLYHVSWRSYEKILDALGDSRAAQLTYYNETLEIVTSLEEHESCNTIPLITKSRIYEFLADCNTQGETQTKRAFRSWVPEQLQQ